MGQRLKQSIGVFLIVIAIGTLGVLIALDMHNNTQAMSEVNTYYNASVDDTVIKDAHRYNDHLKVNDVHNLPYNKVLDFRGGAMGVLSIPKIGIEYTFYHGVADDVLNDYVGHMPTSLLPLGDKGVSVLTAHNGIPAKPLFTDLDLLENGDKFTITIDKTPYTYEVFKQEILPVSEVQAYLERDESIPVVDLMTCYPFGANTHRLIVSGRLVNTDEVQDTQEVQVLRKAALPYYVLIAMSGITLLIVVIQCLRYLIRRYYHA